MTEVAILASRAVSPARVIPNDEIESALALRPGIIERLTGIRQRHYLGPGESLQSLAVEACAAAIEDSKCDPSELDMMIYYSDVPPTLPDGRRLRRTYYEVAPHIQYLLRQRGVAVGGECLNIGGSCVGFISALELVYGLIRAGVKRKVLVFSSANCSSFLEGADKNTAMTFADGAAATVLGAASERGFLEFHCLTEGSGFDSGYFEEYQKMFIDRKRVAEFAPQAIRAAVLGFLQAARLSPDDIDLLIPHQAGLKIIRRGMELAGFPLSKVYLCLQDEGNTGAPSLQMALSRALRERRIGEGSLVALVGFGTGWSYGATAFIHRNNPA